MPTRPFDKSNLATIATRPLPLSFSMSSYAAPLLRSAVLEDRRVSDSVEWPSEAVVDVRLLGKGVCWALGIEAVVALAFYTIWHLWHVWL